VETTRSKILDILRRRHEATIEELTHTLALSPATVRRHLDILQRDGYVSVRPVRRDTGRPHYAFAVTQTGENYLPQHYMRITGRLMKEIVALTPEETAGRTGHELAGLVFARMTDDMVQVYAPQVTGHTLASRVAEVVDALANEGLVFEVTPQGSGYKLRGVDCPCRHMGEGQSDVCRYDGRLLSRLLGVQVEAVPETGEGCAYLVAGP
jgi:predicted ArsR family transcriptional regulator